MACVTQIMCLVSRGRLLLCFLLSLGVVSNVFANVSMSWADYKDGRAYMEMADGSTYGLELFSDVDGVFFDKNKHLVGGDLYVSVFQVSASNPGRPSGFCGAGKEIWLYIYKVDGDALRVRTRVLVSSCLRSISMASQNAGEEAEDIDFSSVKWSGKGFSIEWFYNVDDVGRALRSTSYVLRDNVFYPMGIISEDVKE